MSFEPVLDRLAKALETSKDFRLALDTFECRFRSHLEAGTSEHERFLDAAIERFASPTLTLAISKVSAPEISTWAQIYADCLEAEAFFQKLDQSHAGIIHLDLVNRDSHEALLIKRSVYAAPEMSQSFQNKGLMEQNYWLATRNSKDPKDTVTLDGLAPLMHLQRSREPVIEQARNTKALDGCLAGLLIISHYNKSVEQAVRETGTPGDFQVIIGVEHQSNSIAHGVFDFGPQFQRSIASTFIEGAQNIADDITASRFAARLQDDEVKTARMITFLAELHYFCRATRRYRMSAFVENNLEFCMGQLLHQTGHTFDYVEHMSERDFQHILRDIASRKLSEYGQQADLEKVMTPLVNHHRDGLAEAVMDSILQERGPWFRMKWDKWLAKRHKRGAEVWGQ